MRWCSFTKCSRNLTGMLLECFVRKEDLRFTLKSHYREVVGRIGRIGWIE